MKQNLSIGTRAAALGFAILAVSATSVGTAQAVRVIPEAPSMFAPAPGDVVTSRLSGSAQADNVHSTLRDLRSQLTTTR
jgi:hypothetical protein